MAHPSVRDLRIVLESPSGTVSVLSTAVIPRPPVARVRRLVPASAQRGTWGRIRVVRGRSVSPIASRAIQARSRPGRVKAYGHGLGPGYLPAPTATSGMRTLTIDWDAPDRHRRLRGHQLRPAIHPQRCERQDRPGQLDRAGRHRHGRHGHVRDHGAESGRSSTTCRCGRANDTGPGPWSESLVVRSPLEQPFAPSLTGVTPRDQGLGATWDAPTEDGGSEITSYDLRSIRSNATDTEKLDPNNWTETLSAWTTGDGDLQERVAGLTNGVKYDVQVRAGERHWCERLVGDAEGHARHPEHGSHLRRRHRRPRGGGGHRCGRQRRRPRRRHRPRWRPADVQHPRHQRPLRDRRHERAASHEGRARGR